MIRAMGDNWKQPLLGIMTYKSGLHTEHSYAVLFDGAASADLTHVRVINYAGLPKPPCAALTDKGMPADSGMFFKITPQIADHLVGQVDEIKAELSAEPPIKRHFYASRVTSAAEQLKPRDREQRFAHSMPTNCAHFILQAMQRAGVNLAAIDPELLHADGVEQIANVVDKAMQTPGSSPFRQGVVNGESPILYFRSPQERALLPLLREIPPEALSVLKDGPPVVRTHAARLVSTLQASSAISM